MPIFSIQAGETKHSALPLTAVAFLVLTAITPDAFASSPTYKASECTGNYAGIPQKVECGILVVDETQGVNNGRHVSIPLAVVRAVNPAKNSRPVIFLHGGPGGSALTRLPQMLRGPIGTELIAQDQDWIFFDQRGGKLTSPVLACGDVRMDDSGPQSEDAALALRACGQRFSASGVDLSSFNSVQVVNDIQAIRKVLGIDEYDLFGVSYGTRIAFSVMTHKPNGLRAAVLDSVWSPESKWTEGVPQMISSAVKTVLSRCAEDVDCHKAFPEVSQQLDDLAAKLLDGPQHSVDGATYTASDVGAFLMDAIYDSEGARALPKNIAAFSHGDYSAIAELFSGSNSRAQAQHLTFVCKDEILFERRENVARGTENDRVAQLAVPALERYFDVCSAFPVGSPDPLESKPVQSTVPTLFLSAEIDPGTPPEIAEAASKRFKNGSFVMIPNTTHGVYRNSSCGRKIIRGYLNDPSKKIETECIQPVKPEFNFLLN